MELDKSPGGNERANLAGIQVYPAPYVRSVEIAFFYKGVECRAANAQKSASIFFGPDFGLFLFLFFLKYGREKYLDLLADYRPNGVSDRLIKKIVPVFLGGRSCYHL